MVIDSNDSDPEATPERFIEIKSLLYNDNWTNLLLLSRPMFTNISRHIVDTD